MARLEVQMVHDPVHVAVLTRVKGLSLASAPLEQDTHETTGLDCL